MNNKGLVVFAFEGEQLPQLIDMNENLKDIINHEFEEKPEVKEVGNLFVMPYYKNKEYSKIVVVGCGNKEELNRDTVQKIVNALYKVEVQDLTVDLETFAINEVEEDLVKTLVETINLKNYKFNELMTLEEKIKKPKSIVFVNVEGVGNAYSKGIIFSEAVNNARTLVNKPYSHLDAIELANYAQELGNRLDLDVDIKGLKEIEELNMGAFLGVNKGSTTEPRLITLKYNGNPDSEEWTALVGKGLVFDTGGYSLKSNMVNMKTDMGGSAAVLGAIEIIAKMKYKANVMIVVAATDNRINGHALLPDDVIYASNGKSIEIISTDAEGRLTLADAVQHAQNIGANTVIDVATLTGGVVVALGNEITGLWSNDVDVKERFYAASKKTGELVWELPIMPHVRKAVRASKVADLLNSVGRPGTSLGAAAFIEEFINEGTKWIHLDIAGTASTKNGNDIGPAGATGVMVRTLAEYFNV